MGAQHPSAIPACRQAGMPPLHNLLCGKEKKGDNSGLIDFGGLKAYFNTLRYVLYALRYASFNIRVW